MRLLVLADGEVGRRVCEVLRDRGVVPSVLVVTDGGGAAITNVFVDPPPVEVLAWSELREEAVLGRVRGLDLDVGLLAWWPHVIPSEVRSLCGRVFLNLHPSLLPHGRGKDPNFWALVERTPFGVTIHHVTDEVDAGDIAFQRELTVTWTDDGESLHRRAQDALVELLDANLERIVTGDVPAVPQPQGFPTHRRADLDPRSQIDLDAPIAPRALLDVLRARTFTGHPGAWFDDDGERFEVRIRIEPRRDGDRP